MGAGKVAAKQPPEIERVSGEQVKTPRPTCIHTMLRSRWAEEIQRMGEKFDVSAGADERGRE